MNIKYNEIEKSLEIKDGLKTHYFMMKFIMVLNLMSAILNLYDVDEKGMGFMEIFWMILGILSLITLYFFIFKKSTLEKIPIEKIKQLKEKLIFGRRRFSLELNDGKKRDLMGFKTQVEYTKLKKLFSEIGIQN